MVKRVRTAIVVMGFSGLVAEILLLRELLIVFAGNELSIGIILANWLILEAFGCYFAGRRAAEARRRVEVFTVITILFSLFLVVAVVATRLLKEMLGVSIGESIGFLPMFYSSFLILLPVSVLHGALFTWGCRIYADCATAAGPDDASPAGRVYVYETVGTIIGGIACTYLLIPYLEALHTTAWLALLNFVVCLALLAPRRRASRLTGMVAAALGGLILLTGTLLATGQVERLHWYSVAGQWQNLNVVEYRNSPYGNICVIENEGQYIYFLDGIATIMAPIPDIPFVEKFVNIPLLTHRQPERILILSGGAGGIINEALKHPSLAAIEYAEQDPLLFELLRKFPTELTESELNDPRVKIHHTDGRLLLQTTPRQYDLIFIGILEPASLQTNRYFTQEFFTLARERLNPGGILVFGLPGSMTYLNDELKNLNSSVFHTVKSVFPHVRVIPGDGHNLFLSSGDPKVAAVDARQIMARLTEREIGAEAMLPWHIEKKLHPGWQEWFAEFIEESSRQLNRDFTPLAVFYSISHWNALYSPEFGRFFNKLERADLKGAALVPLLLLAAYFLLRAGVKRAGRPGIPLAIATTGFAGMISSLVLIFTFQAFYGYLFSWIGLLVAAFMAGAAGGAHLVTGALARIRDHRQLFKRMELAIILFSLFLPLGLLAANTWVASAAAFDLLRVLFLVVSLVAGFLVGAQFPLANKLYLGDKARLSRTAALLYTADLLGGWLGGIAGAVVLLPVLGLVNTCLVMGLLKAVSFVIISFEFNDLQQEVAS